ncbi:MAG TPA: thiamine-phosphate kinase [Stellaceae bacterium]|jgi:thiamine-monophosphate kinase|nr:thiamine-phosphate kinase [Stellaceae bacterium]
MADRVSGEPLGEFERIRRLFAPLAGPGGLGLLDDAALVDCPAGQRLVVTADAIVAGVHYLPDDPPDLVGRKLLRVNLSDLAAMGARPLYYLLTTALPAALGSDWLAEFTRGLAEDQRRFGINLLGGDSVATTGPAVLSVTAIGEVAAGMEVRRNDARAGDLVWVSGTIGDAFLGLALLRGAYPQLAPAYRTELIGRFQVPDPRVDLGCRLAGVAHAMIDISDGLIADLGHICETSCVAAVVELASLPLSSAAKVITDEEPGVRIAMAAGGDDYELLFTAPADSTKTIDDLSWVLDLPITRIGRIEPGEGVRLVDAEGRTIPVGQSGYRHF